MADITLTAADGTAFSAHRADPAGAPRGGPATGSGGLCLLGATLGVV